MTKRKITSVGLALLTVMAVAVLLWAAGSAGASPPLGPAAQSGAPLLLNYQGRLVDPVTGEPVPNGFYAITFRIYDAASGGTLVWAETQTVQVEGGLFNVLLGTIPPLSAADFDGTARWLELEVEGETLTPRQRIVSTAYAIQAEWAKNAASASWGGLTGMPAGFADGVDDDTLGGLSPCGDGQVAKWDNVAGQWECANDDTGGGGGGDFWALTGNAGTAPPTNFVGTTDEISLTLAVSGTVGFRLEPTGGTPNVIGGSDSNTVAAGVVGATIGGGGASGFANIASGDYATVGGGAHSTASGEDATVGGGYQNIASGFAATVGGGYTNVVSGTNATVGGGYSNTASGESATVGGGYQNTANATSATVGGGYQNNANGTVATVGGGWQNTVSGSFATVSGGESNTASNYHTTVGGGKKNNASGDRATVGGGYDNTASGGVATVGGGLDNTASGSYAIVGGGYDNTASGESAIVGGGRQNTASQTYATVSGGYQNTANGSKATVGGGESNKASGDNATVGGGQSNTAGSNFATVGGGRKNTASQTYATVGGGDYNTASGERATVGGGWSNTANSNAATVGGGSTNTASQTYATVGGGYKNTASGDYATVPGGFLAQASLYGQMAYASGWFAAAGDAQASLYVLRNSTSDDTETELYLDGSSASQRLTVASGRTMIFDILVAARRDNGDSAVFRREGVIENDAGATSLTLFSTSGSDKDTTGWTIAVEADNTNDALVIKVTGSDYENVRWVAAVHTAEVAW